MFEDVLIHGNSLIYNSNFKCLSKNSKLMPYHTDLLGISRSDQDRYLQLTEIYISDVDMFDKFFIFEVN